MEIRYANAIKKEIRVLGKGDNLYDKSEKLDQYKGYVVSDINANDNTVTFTNGVTLEAGDAQGDVNEGVLRRLQIREAIAAHFEKEQQLFDRGIKVLSLFFIDHVATRVCHNAFAVGIRTMISPAGITQTESKPDEINTRRTTYPTVAKNRIELERP
jgi:restriction endonuclease